VQRSNQYTILFAAVVCLVCAVFVSGAAVALKPLQDANKVLDVQKKVLNVAGAIAEGESLSKEQITARFEERISAVVIELSSGKEAEGVDSTTYDQRKATKDPGQSESAPKNKAGLLRVPHNAAVYQLKEGGEVKAIILPISGMGLWSTLYGFLALENDTNTIMGITFYEHGETPGLGGEVDNARWKSKWSGKKAFADGDFSKIKIEVLKGMPRDNAEGKAHHIDGLSGATITSRGVSNLVQFWLGEHGFGPYLNQLRSAASVDSAPADGGGE
jgi:Na+-transporting NADH:ubiquinone oxidoreductase subunit C